MADGTFRMCMNDHNELRADTCLLHLYAHRVVTVSNWSVPPANQFLISPSVSLNQPYSLHQCPQPKHHCVLRCPLPSLCTRIPRVLFFAHMHNLAVYKFFAEIAILLTMGSTYYLLTA